MMKKVILGMSVFCMSLNILAADKKYEEKMVETISRFSSCESVEDYQALANQFRTIAKVETTEWLPLYYEAQCYILMSFTDNSGSEAKDGHLDKAEIIMKDLLQKAPDESEVFALQSFYYTGRLVVNPPQRAQGTAPQISAAIGKSLSLDANNPRAKYMKLSNEIGTARFFGSDTTPYCKSAQELLDQWDSYQVKSDIHPSWGRDMVEQIVKGCEE